MEKHWSGRLKFVVIGSGIALSACAYALYIYLKKKDAKSIDEGFEDVSRLEENLEKRILVLGLEKAGKSTILSQVTTSTYKQSDIKPTEGFNVTCLHYGGISLNIWEIGGGESFRRYWNNFLQDTDLLVYVVDSADTHNLPESCKVMKALLGDERLAHVPVLVLANKQDLLGALSPAQVADALDLGSIPASKHRVKVLGTQSPPNSVPKHPSITEVEHSIILMTNSN